MSRCDVIVVGAGSGGEVIASRLAAAGMSVVVVENRLVGGQCPFWACMPAKALLRPGQVAAEARRVPGVEGATVAPESVFAWRDEVSDSRDDHGHVHELQSDGVEVVRGHGALSGERTVVVRGNGDAMTLEADKAVVIATGSSAIVPDIDGIEDVDVWDSERVTTASHVPSSMLVIGGGAVGLESAQAWHRLGSDVVVVEAEERVLASEEPFVGSLMAEAMRAQGIDLVVGQTVERVRRDRSGVTAILSNSQEIAVSQVVAASGRSPNTRGIGLESVDLPAEGPIEVDSAMRVSPHDWLFAIGDVNGLSMFTHAAKYQARRLADHLLGVGEATADGEGAIPRCVFTDPAVAAVGSTERKAREAGGNIAVTDADIGNMAEAVVWGIGVGGKAQAVWRDDVLVGATIVGPHPVIELLASFQMAILAGLDRATLRHFVPQFPTFGEMWLDLLE